VTTIIPQLFGIFRRAGYEPLTGYSPHHFYNYRDIPFTQFLSNNKLWGCPGLALQEVMFIEHFRDFIDPKRILVIGNAHGWSTVAVSLIFPGARTVAIDIDSAGIEFTNGLIATNGLSARAVTARSPDSVAAVVKDHLGGPIDFSVIDAVHTVPALIADFAAVHAASAPGACHLLHDVINWNMVPGFETVLATHRLKGKIFTRTPSGMALVHSGLSPAFEAYLDCFSEAPGVFATLRQYCLDTMVDPIPAFRIASQRPK
jgi:hypothetical protein